MPDKAWWRRAVIGGLTAVFMEGARWLSFYSQAESAGNVSPWILFGWSSLFIVFAGWFSGLSRHDHWLECIYHGGSSPLVLSFIIGHLPGLPK